MKKVLVASAALMVAGGMFASVASTAEVKPGVVITGDSRARIWYKDENYFNRTDLSTVARDGQQSMDTRVRFNLTGTSAGGAYVKGRIRLMDGSMGDMDTDTAVAYNYASSGAANKIALEQNNIFADLAYMGIPFNDMFTLEFGKYRSTYGPQGATNNMFYDDVHSTGFRGIIKVGNVEINPFVEYMDEANNYGTNTLWLGNSVTAAGSTLDQREDNDEIRFGAHIKAKVNKDWTVGGVLGYQSDARTETVTPIEWNTGSITANEGFFGSLYVNGKSGAFGLIGELAVTQGELNGFNTWSEDTNVITPADAIGSDDTGFGGYVFPTYTVDKFTIGVNMGFTTGGYQPDIAYGFVMIGGFDNSAITATRIGLGGDWLWAGLVASYQISDSLKLTGNLVFASIDPWTEIGEGPGYVDSLAQQSTQLDSAFEVSAVLQYTVLKGANIFFSAGYMKPEYDNPSANVYNVVTNPGGSTTVGETSEDGQFGIMTRVEISF